jgi:hypothetical protein
MDVRLAGTWTVGLIFFTFGIQEFVHPWSMLGEYE